MKKSILTAILLITIPSIIFAGTLFEDQKRTSDPFVGDRGGFNSLFVNPAGAAGQSGFELALNVGGVSTSNDVKLIMSVADMATSMSSDDFNEASVVDIAETLTDLYDSGVIGDGVFEGLFKGTDLLGPDGLYGTADDVVTDWSDINQIQAVVDDGAIFDSTDLDQIGTNVDEIMDGTNTAFFLGLPGEISVDAAGSLKTGFLIKGWGLGVYDHAVSVAFMDPVDQTYGLKTIYNELGVIAGGGFNLRDGKWALGFSGNYGALMRNTSPVGFEDFDTLLNGSVNYGYTWGLDIGVIWRPTPALGVGLVVNDVIGYTEADTPYTANGIEGFFEDGNYLMDEFNYEVTTDFDLGLSWQPDWRFVQPKLGVDFYNVVGYGRDVADEDDDFDDAMYRMLNHLRLGANFTFFKFLKIGTQYHDNYLSAGLGLDLLFLELYGEYKISDQFVYADDIEEVPMGLDLMVRIHF